MLRRMFTAEQLKGFWRYRDKKRFNIKEKKEVNWEEYAVKIGSDIDLKDYTTLSIKGKNCIIYKDYAATLVLRVLTRYISRRFRVVPPNRNKIVRGVIETLFDQTPLYIIRRDLSSFYENIPIEKTRKRLLNKDVIRGTVLRYLEKYYSVRCSEQRQGLPRGAGLTAILVELSMQDFDQKIRKIPGVYRYFRYVDDILIFAYKDPKDIKKTLEDILKEKLPNMEFNSKKTADIDWKRADPENFEFLGYEFRTKKKNVRNPRELEVRIAKKKLNRIKTRLYLSFKVFKKDRKARDLLNRLQLLSGNYPIDCKKEGDGYKLRNVYAGIYYNYKNCGNYKEGKSGEGIQKDLEDLEDLEDLKDLDNFMYRYMKSKHSPFTQELKNLSQDDKKKLYKLSFEKGFSERIKVTFSSDRINSLKGIWRNV